MFLWCHLFFILALAVLILVLSNLGYNGKLLNSISHLAKYGYGMLSLLSFLRPSNAIKVIMENCNMTAYNRYAVAVSQLSELWPWFYHIDPKLIPYHTV